MPDGGNVFLGFFDESIDYSADFLCFPLLLFSLGPYGSVHCPHCILNLSSQLGVPFKSSCPDLCFCSLQCELFLGCILHFFLFLQNSIICKLSTNDFQFMLEDLTIRTCLMPISPNLVFHLFVFGNPSIKSAHAHTGIKSALRTY